MIELKDIHKTYLMGKFPVKALDGVSLTIAPGEFVAIMGPSGSGKSTLMHIIGLLDRPNSGSYLLDGKRLTGFTDEQVASIRNKLVGFVFQQFHLLPRMSALENAELPLVYAGKLHLKENAKHALEAVGLGDRVDHRPNELSGGQQQRVAIARSLVNDPLIILADEPTGNLDTKSEEEIIAILKKLNNEGKTIVVVTHEKEIADSAKRIICMRDGRIVSDSRAGSPPEPGKTFAQAGDMNCLLSGRCSSSGKAKFLDYFKQAVGAMFTHKMRSALSILGILIGVAAVIAMLALGEGAKASIQTQLASLGSNLLVIRPGSPRVQGVALESGSVTRLTFQDVESIKRLSEIQSVSPSVSGRGQMVYANKNWNTQVEGVGVDYAPMRAAVPAVGRFFNEHEVKTREKVVVLGVTVARELFGDSDPIGQTVKINLNNFKVIGILPAKGSAGFRDPNDTVLVPVTTAMYRLLGKQYLDSIYAEARSAGVIEQAQEAIKSVVRKQRRSSSNGEDSFEIRNMADIKSALETTTQTMSLLLGSIAAISLFVGGIGIMNIMLVSVTERTREIGLRKAIGANNQDIMVQFLIEAVLLSLIGGAGGVLLGAGASFLITFFAKWTAAISAFSVILATLFSFVIGLLFGLWPARQASRLNPIEALRYE
ncbi:MAG: ABC transporter permease [Candidatus Omnitrophota bacterium]